MPQAMPGRRQASFTLDSVVPGAPTVALTLDTGTSNSDKITSNGALTVTPAEAGGVVEYSINGGSSWTSSFSAVEGVNNVQVRQIDAAGNAGSATSFSFTLDRSAPVANNASPSGDEDTAILVALSGTDTGGSGVAAYELSTLPSNGTLYTDARLTTPAVAGTAYASNTFYFMPDTNYTGGASFDYTATDNAGN